MPRFYIHTDDGDVRDVDHLGFDLPNAAAARTAALQALRDMARDMLSDGDNRVFEVKVEDEEFHLVYEATLRLSGEWTKRRG